MVFFEVDCKPFAKGACKEGTPSAEERNEEQHNNMMDLRN